MTADRGTYEPVARAAAARHKVPADMFVRQIDQESGFDPEAHNPGSDASGIAQIVPSAHPDVDPWDPYASLEYAATWLAGLYELFGSWALALAAYNAGPGNVAKYGGVPPFPETQRYLTAILGPGWPEPDTDPATVVYDPDVPDELQQQDWTCSVRTAAGMLHSVGDWVPAEQVQDLMVNAGIVSPDVGLHEGDGSELAEFLHDRTGLPAGNTWADYDWLLQVAGTRPVGIGSPTLYHWVQVRKVAPDGDTLLLNNPSPGWKGVGQELTRAEFEAWAPWAAVWLNLSSVEEDPAVIEQLKEEIEHLKGEVQEWKDKFDAERSWNSSAVHDTLEPGLARLEEATVERGQVGWRKVRAFIDSVGKNLDVHPSK